MTDDLLLPEGAVLVHVGPYKTGTSAIQMALHQRRPELADLGVCYPGKGYRHMRQAAAVLRRSPRGVGKVPMKEWRALVDEVHAAGPTQRSLVSSEGMCTADEEHARQVVEDLGADRVHVVAVARRLDRLLPSVWQERVKSSNEVRPYGEFLDDVLGADRDSKGSRAFWKAHGLDHYLRTWTAVLPPERVLVLVAQEGDRSQLPRAFEGFLGLPEGFLTAEDRPNSSLSWEKVELYRQLNLVFDAEGWPHKERRKYLQRGMLNALRDLPSSAAGPAIPALDRARADRVAELSRERVALVRDAGVRVIGDPERLMSEPPADPSDGLPAEPGTVAVETAAAAVHGVLSMVLRRGGVDQQEQA